MKSISINTVRNAGLGLVALLAIIPLVYAQRGQPPARSAPVARGAPAPRSAPAPAHASVQHSPAMIVRANHGTIRHVDTHIVERSAAAPRAFEQHQQILVHHDVQVDIPRNHFWHGFAYGARHHSLRQGYYPLLVNGAPFFYDDGIYYQQAGSDYLEVYPPTGAVVQSLPDGAMAIEAGDSTYYYAGGAFYVQQSSGFVIIAPPLGLAVPELPPGAVQVSVNGSLAYQFNGISYQPVFVNGVTQYVIIRP